MKRKLLMNYEILMNQNYGIAAEMTYVVYSYRIQSPSFTKHFRQNKFSV